MGVDLRMNLPLFLTIFISSVGFLILFHIIFLGLWYMGLVSRVARKRPELLPITQNCTVISIACCVFYSHCGNIAIVTEKHLDRKSSSWFSLLLWKKQDTNSWISKFIRMNEFKDQICSTWFAPVGTASDYPFFSKWVIYGELACNGSCPGLSDEISPIFSLWATFMGLYMAHYVVEVERSTGWALTHTSPLSEYEKLKKQMKPDFLEMVPWYSGTSADLFKTVFDLMASVTLFVGRFDMRMMQAAMNKVPDEAKNDDIFFDHFSKGDDFWFDFIADTGDGGNSTYAVARLLAKPSVCLRLGDSNRSLSRGKLLLIGGDLAILVPKPFSIYIHMRDAFFCPFEDALQSPSWYKLEHIAVNKPELPYGVSELSKYDGPQCFIIPGNHDWFYGLHTFMRYICHKSWLGGWFLPQKKSYFTLELPKGWWIFGLDQALHGDIDVYQFKFFTELCQKKVGENDCVIIITHEPSWLLDWYWNDVTGKNVSHLIKDYLKGRCKLRMAGDLHHYMCHSSVPSDKPVYVEHLLVNGCGGAFLHPTHVFRKFNNFYGSYYESKATYPSYDDSSRIALGNILKFRRKNWQFDFIGGIIYFLLVFSMFPQYLRCHLPLSGYHTLYEWYRSMESEHFPDPSGLRARIEQWTFGLYPACIKYLMSAFDVPEVMAVSRSNICRKGIEILPRGGAIIYYDSVFLYFWVLSTPVFLYFWLT
ncbi:hypothetical protein ZIOFF_044418 [Zingiber officinale]|uniref:Calcineurin-like phosphoesterase domain-containing protein n=1 Tax=Zingiber officinale TaxID=94328 RepID=A0A8J5FYG8_ZINOF|nr:hypothetical protein ZIOFF_044418 [Zingiber officinale]